MVVTPLLIVWFGRLEAEATGFDAIDFCRILLEALTGGIGLFPLKEILKKTPKSDEIRRSRCPSFLMKQMTFADAEYAAKVSPIKSALYPSIPSKPCP